MFDISAELAALEAIAVALGLTGAAIIGVAGIGFGWRWIKATFF